LFEAHRLLDAYQAAHEVNHHVGAFGFNGAEGAQAAVGFILGALAHNTGIHHQNVGLFDGGGIFVAQVLQGRRHPLRIGHVHLAAFSPDVVLHAADYNRNWTSLVEY
jgi:hypothetical protein